MVKIGISISPIKSKFGPLLFSGNLNRGLEVAHLLGFDGVELSLLDSKSLDYEWLIKKLEKLNLNVFAIATGQTYYSDGYSLYSYEDSKRRKAIERIKSHIDLASKLNSMVIIGGIRGKLTEEDEKRIKQKENGLAAVNECVKYAENKNVILLIEPINRYETNIINTLEEGMDLINQIGSNNLKLLPDTFHMNIEEKDICQSLSKAKSYIGYIHFADSNRCAPGFGHINFKEVLEMLKKINYEFPIGVEILPKPDDYKAAKKAITYIINLQKGNI